MSWVSDGRARQEWVIPAFSVDVRSAFLTHTFVARYSEVKGSLTKETSLLWYSILGQNLNDEGEDVVKIESKCVDMRTECAIWKRMGKCSKKMAMDKLCRLSCDMCGEQQKTQDPHRREL